MKIVFFGNTRHSLIGLKILHSELNVSFIVTIDGSPTQNFARENSIPFIITKRFTPETTKQIKTLGTDFFVVEDYGLILPEDLLDIPKVAALNVHHSLLPKYRGASPAPSAILAGEKVTGVSIIKMTDKVDAGDILEQKEYPISSEDTTDTILTALNKIGGKLVTEVIKNYEEYEKKAKKQDESEVTFTQFMKKEDGKIDLDSPPTAEILDRMIRAYFPWPGVWTKTIVNNKLSIIKFLPEKRIQVEGKKPISYKDFLNGYPKLQPELVGLLEKLE